MSNSSISIVVPNWNGKDGLAACLDSLLAQSRSAEIIVVDNGSVDGSAAFIKERYPTVVLLENAKNLGFAGGVNTGIRHAIASGSDYVALFNNDAVADSQWLEQLAKALETQNSAGIAACKLLTADKKSFDSTGELYTSWGLPYPRGRGEPASNVYDHATSLFAASGGASLYRVGMLQEIGLFDEDFFAYYEDVDISFRAQLAGWQVIYTPAAVAYHHIGASSAKIKGFTTYQTLKNVPLLFWKNVPLGLMPTIMPRLALSDTLFYLSAVRRGQFLPATKGMLHALALIPKKLWQRRSIQKNKKVNTAYIRSLLVYDLPPNARNLRRFRARWWKLVGKGASK